MTDDPIAEFEAANPCTFELDVNGSITIGYGQTPGAAELDACRKAQASEKDKKQTFNTEINKHDKKDAAKRPFPKHWVRGKGGSFG